MATAKGKGGDTPARMWLRRVAWSVGAVTVVAFAVEGGEYGTSDLIAQKSQRIALEDSVSTLRDSVAVLRKAVDAMKTDPAVLERVAREKYGMVKGTGEFLYWTVRRGADSAARPVDGKFDDGD